MILMITCSIILSNTLAEMEKSSDTSLILINGQVITMDPLRPKAAWVVVQNNRIKCTGRGEAWKKFRCKKTKIIDCKGRAVLPGFIDAHLHLHAFAESLVSLNIRPDNGIQSIGDIQSSIHTYSRQVRPGTWIRGKGYDEFYLSEKRHPNRWDLDEAAPDHPVKITHRSSHAHVLNSAALKLVGISPETADPPEGMIDRDLKTGEPTGLLYEMGSFLSARIPSLGPIELEKAVSLANQELLSKGITSIQDASASNNLERWACFKKWKMSSILEPRVAVLLGFSAFEAFRQTAVPSHLEDHQLRVSGVKIILDETTGRLCPSQAELDRMVFEIHQAGLQAAVHAIEENAVEAAINAIGRALERRPRTDHRHRIEHCSVCPPHLARKIAIHKIMVVTQPLFLYHSGDRYLKAVDDHTLSRLYPLKTLIRHGVTVSAGSDCPVVMPNPLLGIYTAISRMSKTGRPVTANEGIDFDEAVALHTIQAARAALEENIKGSITPGKLADLVILTSDPTRLLPHQLKDLEVKTTILNGELAWDQ